MAFLELSDIDKRFGETVILRRLHLDVEQGTFIVLLGSSGSGKSTLLRIIAGLEQVTSGHVRLAGVDITHTAPAARGVAMVFQNYALYPHMTVEENLGFALTLARLPHEECVRRVAAAAAILELGGLLKRKPGELSGGQRQRVAIGRAIVREPRLFLFDEPLSNLDASLRTQTRLELKKLQARLGVTTVYVTHDQIEAMSLADRICLLNQGQIAQYDTPTEIYRRPANLFVAGFVGQPAMNLLPGRIESGAIVVAGYSFVVPNAAPTGQLTVGLRPPELGLSTDSSTGPAAKVAWVEELGASRLVHVEVAGLTIRVELFTELPSGQLYLDTSHATWHLFDRQSGQRL